MHKSVAHLWELYRDTSRLAGRHTSVPLRSSWLAALWKWLHSDFFISDNNGWSECSPSGTGRWQMIERTLDVIDVRSHEVTHAIPSPYLFFRITEVYISHVYASKSQPGPEVKATAFIHLWLQIQRTSHSFSQMSLCYISFMSGPNQIINFMHTYAHTHAHT